VRIAPSSARLCNGAPIAAIGGPDEQNSLYFPVGGPDEHPAFQASRPAHRPWSRSTHRRRRFLLGVLGARLGDRIQSLADELNRSGGKALAITTDVTHRDQVKKLVDTAVQTYGRIDVMINNAGLMTSQGSAHGSSDSARIAPAAPAPGSLRPAPNTDSTTIWIRVAGAKVAGCRPLWAGGFA
jgi:hypothetical protein